MYKILVVEDDLALCENIVQNLRRWNFEVAAAGDFEHITHDVLAFRPHLILMDVNLPYFDGFYWCRQIRELVKTPILFLSSRDSSLDVILAVTQGADDYVTKPFSFDLLVVKIQALLRRAYDYQTGEREVLEVKGMLLDMERGTLLYQGQQVELTKNEHKILCALIKNRGKVVSREKLMKILWDEDEYVNENTLTVNINRMRSKLEEMGISDLITTKKGEGYLIQ